MIERSHYFQPPIFGLSSAVSWSIRNKMFRALMELAKPLPKWLILDVGVSCEQRKDSNFFEKLYPYPEMITAVGREDAFFLEKEYPGLRFVKSDGTSLPFKDKSFDLTVSFSTIEHVGDRNRQRDFVREICRVSKACCITTPNRWYPLEFHSILPLVHWLPDRIFRALLKLVGKDFLAQQNNLNLLTEKELLMCFPQSAGVYIKHFRLFGLISNLLFYAEC